MGYRNGDVHGIGGWLAVFVTTLVLDALVTIIQACHDLPMLLGRVPIVIGNPGWLEAVAASTLAMLASAAALLWFAWLLHRRRDPRTPRTVGRWLWLAILGPPLVRVAGLVGVFGPGAYATGRMLADALVQPLAYCLIWSLYFARSRRVAATYGTGASDEELAGVFG